MSNSRHAQSNPDDRPAEVRSYSITHPPGRVALPIQPGWDALVLAEFGVFTAVGETDAWTVPAHRALCVPDGEAVRLDTPRRTAMRCVYFRKELGVIGEHTRVVGLTPLARELTLHAVDCAPMWLDSPVSKATIVLLAERLAAEPDAELQLPLPTETIAREMAMRIVANPADALDDQLRESAASRRTLERRFAEETGMSLGQWRRRARVLAAVNALASGESVTSVASTTGYASPSSFASAFRAELGLAPSAFRQASSSE